MNETQFEGAARTAGGRVQDAVGGLTGDAGLQAEGKLNQLKGKAQNTFGAAADEVQELGEQVIETVKSQPLAALLIVGVASYALGRLTRR